MKRIPAGPEFVESQAVSTRKTKSMPKDAFKTHRRSRTGCFTCRLRRKKCDEGKPFCKACKHLSVDCEYKRPAWWSNTDRRRAHKEVIKNLIKQTKLLEKPSKAVSSTLLTTLSLHMPAIELDEALPAFAATRTASVDIASSPPSEIETPNDAFYAATPQLMPSSSWPVHDHQTADPALFDVEIKFAADSFPHDLAAHESFSISALAECSSLPFTVTDATMFEHIYHGDYYERRLLDVHANDVADSTGFVIATDNLPANQALTVGVDECDHYLLDHFVNHVARLVFPVLEVHRNLLGCSEAILAAMATNKCYLHCCLSISALHLKITGRITDEQIDHDTMRHRCAAITELCEAFRTEVEPSQFLQATLGMIFFQTSVSSVDNSLPDIPWHQHFEAATNLINRLGPSFHPHAQLAPNMTLAAWIDILGATMVGRITTFSDVYRENLQADVACGLEELMGCDDRIMYLISEIACLEALKADGMDAFVLCNHITNLGEQLTFTEDHEIDASLLTPAQVLVRHISAIFRIAARVYLCSLVPDFDRYGERMLSLVDQTSLALEFIPDGPEGYDRCLAWPMLIVGSVSSSTSSLRRVIRDRAAQLGESASFGSYDRVMQVLEETWRVNDELSIADSFHFIHWRDVMLRHGWDFLLI